MLAALLLLFTIAAADAQTDGWQATASELELYQHLDQRRFVKAREQAEQLLKLQPDSFVALFVLGSVEHYAEGNLSRGLRLLKQARERFEKHHGPLPGQGQPWRWHAEILKELAWLSGEMDQRQEELGYLDAHDAVYAPPLYAERAWPLMKLGRTAEARQVIELALLSKQPDQVDRALTARCAIEYEAQNRQASFEACNAAAEAERRDPHPGSIPFGNAAEAAMAVLRFDVAEKLTLEATRQRAQGGDNPWAQLAMIYLTQARLSEAGQALRQAISFRKKRPAYLNQQMRAETENAAATFLIAAGQHQAALRFTSRAMNRPDRGGLKSGMPEIALAGASLAHHAAARGAAEEVREQASAAPLGERARLVAHAIELELEAFRAGRRAASVLAGRDKVVATLRPYLGGGAQAATFVVPDLVALVGPGVAEAAVARARSIEQLAEALPFLDELDAEAALQRGRPQAALELGKRALERLPVAEKLLEARAAAVAGEAAARLGRRDEARALLSRALQRDPGALRRLGLRLRVRVSHDGSPIAARAAELLGRSPRLRTGGGDFEVRVSARSICLSGSDGALLGCGEPQSDGKQPDGKQKPTKPPTAEQAARALCDAFHAQVFAPRLDMSQIDLTSLDGSTSTAGGAASDQTRILLKDLTGG